MMLMILAGMAMQAAPAPTTAKPAADPGKKVCRSEAATGSIMGRRVCHTRAEWAAMSKASGSDVNNFRDQSTNGGIPFNAGR